MLAWVARGRTDWQIAEILYLSVKTVNYHVQRAKSKLGVSSRTQYAVASAVALGYGPAFEDAASVSVEAHAEHAAAVVGRRDGRPKSAAQPFLTNSDLRPIAPIPSILQSMS